MSGKSLDTKAKRRTQGSKTGKGSRTYDVNEFQNLVLEPMKTEEQVRPPKVESSQRKKAVVPKEAAAVVPPAATADPASVPLPDDNSTSEAGGDRGTASQDDAGSEQEDDQTANTVQEEGGPEQETVQRASGFSQPTAEDWGAMFSKRMADALKMSELSPAPRFQSGAQGAPMFGKGGAVFTMDESNWGIGSDQKAEPLRRYRGGNAKKGQKFKPRPFRTATEGERGGSKETKLSSLITKAIVENNAYAKSDTVGHGIFLYVAAKYHAKSVLKTFIKNLDRIDKVIESEKREENGTIKKARLNRMMNKEVFNMMITLSVPMVEEQYVEMPGTDDIATIIEVATRMETRIKNRNRTENTGTGVDNQAISDLIEELNYHDATGIKINEDKYMRKGEYTGAMGYSWMARILNSRNGSKHVPKLLAFDYLPGLQEELMALQSEGDSLSANDASERAEIMDDHVWGDADNDDNYTINGKKKTPRHYLGEETVNLPALALSMILKLRVDLDKIMPSMNTHFRALPIMHVNSKARVAVANSALDQMGSQSLIKEDCYFNDCTYLVTSKRMFMLFSTDYMFPSTHNVEQYLAKDKSADRWRIVTAICDKEKEIMGDEYYDLDTPHESEHIQSRAVAEIAVGDVTRPLRPSWNQGFQYKFRAYRKDATASGGTFRDGPGSQICMVPKAFVLGEYIGRDYLDATSNKVDKAWSAITQLPIPAVALCTHLVLTQAMDPIQDIDELANLNASMLLLAQPGDLVFIGDLAERITMIEPFTWKNPEPADTLKVRVEDGMAWNGEGYDPAPVKSRVALIREEFQSLLLKLPEKVREVSVFNNEPYARGPLEDRLPDGAQGGPGGE